MTLTRETIVPFLADIFARRGGEEYLGEPVTMELADGPAPRIVAAVQVTWLKRALRNLVSNAVRYGECARVSVRREVGRSEERYAFQTGTGERADVGAIFDEMHAFFRRPESEQIAHPRYAEYRELMLTTHAQ